MYRVYKDEEVHFVVSTDGVLKKFCRWLDQDTWVEEFQPVPQEELTKTWNEIVSRMVNKTKQEERNIVLCNIKSVLFNN